MRFLSPTGWFSFRSPFDAALAQKGLESIADATKRIQRETFRERIDRISDRYTPHNPLTEQERVELVDYMVAGNMSRDLFDKMRPGAVDRYRRDRDMQWEARLAARAVVERYAEDDLLDAGREDYKRMHKPYGLDEKCRIYVWEEMPNRRGVLRYARKPDGVTMKDSAGRVQVRNSERYVYVENAKMQRDVNGHLRAYVKDPMHYQPLVSMSWMTGDWDTQRYRKGSQQMEFYKYGAEAVLRQADYSKIEERILAHMSMSRDRVEFTLDLTNAVWGNKSDAPARAAMEALGLDIKELRGRSIRIRCRPSQFARWMILRNQYGGTNDFKGLRAELIIEEPKPEFFDVSKNPNTVRGIISV